MESDLIIDEVGFGFRSVNCCAIKVERKFWVVLHNDAIDGPAKSGWSQRVDARWKQK